MIPALADSVLILPGFYPIDASRLNGCGRRAVCAREEPRRYAAPRAVAGQQTRGRIILVDQAGAMPSGRPRPAQPRDT
jgi:hypothetical protein